MKAAIFDLDGTLIDPTEGIAAAYRHVSSVLGLPPPELERICDEIGPPIRDAVSSLFGLRKSEVEQAVATFREYYGRRGVQQFVPYAGVSDALKRLRHDGFLLRIATSKLARYASEIVARAEWGGLFDKVCGSSEEPIATTKTEIVRQALEGIGRDDSFVVLVGDRGEDLLASRENALPFIGVSWGFSPNQRLKDQGAEYIASSPEELTSMIRNLNSSWTAIGAIASGG